MSRRLVGLVVLFTPAKPPGIEPAATLSRALAAAPEALRRSPVTKR
jgi:hypothetical protein